MIAATGLNLFDNEATLVILKGITLLILIFYAIFALIVIRQVELMGKTLITNVSGIVKTIAMLHTGFAIGLIVLAWIIL